MVLRLAQIEWRKDMSSKHRCFRKFINSLNAESSRETYGYKFQKFMKWGALTNAYPTNAKLNEISKILPHDKKWHSLFEEKDQVHIDGVTVRRKNLDSMT